MDISFIILIGLMIVFLIWSSHSQRKQQNAYQNYINFLVVGSPVETIGGLKGVIVEINDDEFTVNVGAKKQVLIRVGRVGIKFPGMQQQKVEGSGQKSVDAEKSDKAEKFDKAEKSVDAEKSDKVVSEKKSEDDKSDDKKEDKDEKAAD